jgi:hypothetical protein
VIVGSGIPDGTQHVIYVGHEGQIHELWWNGSWHHNNLSGAAGAPIPSMIGHDADGHVHPDGTQHVNYRAADAHLQELWWDGQRRRGRRRRRVKCVRHGFLPSG